MWKYYNPNPVGKKTGDCSVRAVAKAMEEQPPKTSLEDVVDAINVLADIVIGGM